MQLSFLVSPSLPFERADRAAAEAADGDGEKKGEVPGSLPVYFVFSVSSDNVVRRVLRMQADRASSFY